MPILTYQGPHDGVVFLDGDVQGECAHGQSVDIKDAQVAADFVAGGDWVEAKSKKNPGSAGDEGATA